MSIHHDHDHDLEHDFDRLHVQVSIDLDKVFNFNFNFHQKVIVMVIIYTANSQHHTPNLNPHYTEKHPHHKSPVIPIRHRCNNRLRVIEIYQN
jgi:hypothetical protein